MMSLIDLDDDQRWVPTHVNVTVLCARGLRTKGKHGSRYVYTIIQVGKEKYTTGLVEKAAMPQWNEECCFELLPAILEAGGRNDYPPGSGDLVLTVMHRVLIGLDVFLGQAIIPLDKIFNDGVCPRDEWLRLNSKAGRKEKERGELQVTVQFTRNNMTASMFDLTMKDKPRSTFGKLKDRVTGRKRGDMESSSAIVPGRFAALSGSPGQPYGEGVGGTGVNTGDLEIAEDKKSKVKNFFKGRLRRSSDTRSCSSLASDSSASSMASEKPCPPPCLDLLADPPSSPIYSSKVKVDTHYGETDLAQKALTSQPSGKLTHKRAFSDEASKITTSLSRPCPAVESLKGQTMSQSQSSLCINGSHVYGSEPCTPKSSGTLPSKLVLLEKCSPLSRSLQNLTRRSDDKGSPGESRRWSFDKEKKEEEMEVASAAPQVQSARIGARPVQAAALIVCSSTTADSTDKGKKLRKTLFSGGRSDSLPAKSDMSHTGTSTEGRLRGWFGSSESQNKPRLEVSPKVESSSDLPPPIPPRSPIPPQCSSPTAILCRHGSPDSETNPNTFSPSPSPTAISPTNPFLPQIKRNPFFKELIAEETRKSPPLASPSISPLSHSTALPSQPRIPSHAYDGMQKKMAAIRRERPRAVARQTSLPALLPRPVTPGSPNLFATRSISESGGEFEESFDAFASSRLNSPKEKPVCQHPSITNTAHAHRRSNPPVDNSQASPMERLIVCEEEPPPLPPRKAVRTPVTELYTDSWLHRGQELAVQKEACLLSQTGVASLQRVRDGERKTNAPSISPDLQTDTSLISDCLAASSHQKANMTSPVFMVEDQLRKFKYEPLEDQTDCFRGMLYEQDFCGPGMAGSFGEPKVNNAQLSLNREETTGNEILSMTTAPFHNPAAVTGPKMLLDSDISVADLLSMSVFQNNTSISEKTDLAFTTSKPAQLQSTSSPHSKPASVNNNISPSFTLEDLNMNMNNSDFSFIDSDGSSPSEIADTLKGIKGLGATFPQPSEDSPSATYHGDIMPDAEKRLPLNQTSFHEINSTFDTDTLTDKQLICQDNSQVEGCERYELSEKDSKNAKKEVTECTEAEPVEMITREMVESKKAQAALDDNGNPQAKVGTPLKNDSPLKALSARRSLKGRIRELHGSPINHSRKEQNILGHPSSPSQTSLEGPFSYQPTKMLSSPAESSSNKEQDEVNELNTKPLKFLHQATGVSIETKQKALNVAERSTQEEVVSFEDLHAKVAPNSRSPLKLKTGLSLQDSSSCASSPSSVSSLSAGGNDQAKLPPTPTPSLHIQPPTTKLSLEVSATLAVAPYTSSSSFSSSCSSSSSSFTTAQPSVDARHSLLPEETQPASNLPIQESSPHPVKPLTTTLSQAEKKEGRSVLEKLKSTIHPGRTTQQAVTEPEKSLEVSVADAAQFQHLTNMELISLLLQQGMDMEKQRTASEQQGAMLEKRETELKKVKSQVRDLEDYIDKLLVRIMEQTPTLLQVRSRHK